MNKRMLAGLAVGAIALVGVAIPTSASAATGAKLSVLHAVPDTPVDVYVNGALTLDNFQPGDLAGPLDLAAGTYSVAITAADAADASKPVIGPIDLALADGGNYTAVAHLKEDGTPTATLYTNDTSTTTAGEGRLTVRHTAAAPAVDVLAGGSAVISGLVNPGEKVLNLPAGTISASVAAAGTTAPVIGPADVTVAEGTNTIVYAWGSLTANNLKLAVQTIDGLHGNPSGIPSGTAGLVGDRDDSGALIAGGSALALLLAAGFVVLMRRRSRVGA
ncbi:DUF4397 domain-containing protein [Subtercola boreus]|uniref:DUF4397 domain-containing protein n=1 Tax=Subtercola boreus TaxID=120213 RepID=A0A3E0WA02_9MICO|nr:DUF4397 domain-containing protein [Subtercola boreus]RFA17959.1 hypothetical protein B7R24_14950 [Subtercola boreus]RFA18341.1 hypothetical protein B7R23_14985 [Subtercola boreus]RFA25097.1 hypothetical protein B7R25_14980 [Subtercola boreus]